MEGSRGCNQWRRQPYCGAIEGKDERGMFFYFPMRLNPTSNTPIPDHPARFLFLAPIAKYLDETFPDCPTRRHPFEAPINRTRPVSGPLYVCVFCWFVIISFICWLLSMYIISLLSKLSPGPWKYTRTERKKIPPSRPPVSWIPDRTVPD